MLFLLNIFFAKEISFLLFKDNKYYLLIIFAAISIPLSLVNPILDSLIRGLKRFDDFVRISVFVAAFTLLFTLVLVYLFEIEGAIISLTISAFFAFLTYFFYFKKKDSMPLSEFFSLNFNYSQNFKTVVKIGIAGLIVGVADKLSQLIIRIIVIDSLGINANGLYQCIYAISLNYFSVLFISLGIYLLPILSEMKDKDSVNSELNSTLKLTFIIIVPLITILFSFRKYLILLFYSKEFLPSTDLLFFNFLGDYFKAFSWIVGSWLIPLSRIKAWVVFSMIYYVNFPVLFYILLHFFNLGLKSVVISYFISFIVHSVINLYGFKFSDINLKLFPLSFLFIFVVMLISNYNPVYGYVIILPSVLLWFMFAVTKEEMIKVCAAHNIQIPSDPKKM